MKWGVVIGAKAMPKRFRENPKMATVIDTLNSSITEPIPAV